MARKKALTTVTRIHPHAGSFLSYMDRYVNPVLLRGLEELCRERPEDPIDFLAYYILENNLNLVEDSNKDDNEKVEENNEADLEDKEANL